MLKLTIFELFKIKDTFGRENAIKLKRLISQLHTTFNQLECLEMQPTQKRRNILNKISPCKHSAPSGASFQLFFVFCQTHSQYKITSSHRVRGFQGGGGINIFKTYAFPVPLLFCY